jgi:hypothetical protein
MISTDSRRNVQVFKRWTIYITLLVPKNLMFQFNNYCFSITILNCLTTDMIRYFVWVHEIWFFFIVTLILFGAIFCVLVKNIGYRWLEWRNSIKFSTKFEGGIALTPYVDYPNFWNKSGPWCWVLDWFGFTNTEL